MAFYGAPQTLRKSLSVWQTGARLDIIPTDAEMFLAISELIDKLHSCPHVLTDEDVIGANVVFLF